MANVSCKIQDWSIKLNKNGHIVVVSHKINGSTDLRENLFYERGMKMFPKELYKLICTNLPAANIYDKFMGKFYDYIGDKYE